MIRRLARIFRPSPPSPSRESPLPASAATETDTAMMRRALDLARRAIELDETPIAAVIYHTESGELLAEAHNRRELDADPTDHAEILALRDAAAKRGDWRLNDCTLIVTLEPCAMCAGAIVNARVGRLVYAAADPKAGACESLYTLSQDPRLNHRVRPIAGLLADESAQLLRDFFQSKRKSRRASN
ncbi:MAG: tRNA adenosine(34) deaminase TadA [Planctomycetota bacterium]|nr:tRNA adenosine(34) deaminase TadA [Planctomycetota bacterium]